VSFSLLYQFPTWLQRLYTGVVWRKDSSSKVVYLTFDDGPIPECTPAVLDILARYGVKASFFMVAANAERYPELLMRVRLEGHTVGNHTYHHMRGHQSCMQNYVADALRGESVLATKLFRPPHGRMRYSQKNAMLAAGYTIYLWDVLTHDYNPRYSVEKILSVVKRYTRNGSIIVMHDSIKSRDRMLKVLPLVIEWLQSEGYQLEAL
jgi:peptidoglycan/xylan/chitin deacetylase (PgdA/CDA1 family)